MQNDIFEVKVGLQDINFMPSSELEEIAQNVLTIISTTKFSVPLDRGFGIDTQLLDSPLPAVKAKLTAEIVAAVAQFEPRARVTEVLFGGQPISGFVQPVVRFRLAKKS